MSVSREGSPSVCDLPRRLLRRRMQPRRIGDAMEEARRCWGNASGWVNIAGPEMFEAWNRQQMIEKEYLWYMLHRLSIVRLFDAWGDPRVLPVLAQTLRRARLVEEQQCDLGVLSVLIVECWRFYQDLLVDVLTHLGIHEQRGSIVPRQLWPEHIGNACFDTWVDEVDMPEREDAVDAFVERWGGLDALAFTQVLHEGDATQRLFAIFALGNLAPPDVEGLLSPFLEASERKERWASAIALGRLRYEKVFPLLQGLLEEEMDYLYPYDPTLFRQKRKAVEEAERRGYSYADWEEMVDASVVVAYYQEIDDEKEYHWFMIHRLTITRLFGDWADLRALPTLRYALARCQALEQQRDPETLPYDVQRLWRFYQKLLEETIDLLEA